MISSFFLHMLLIVGINLIGVKFLFTIEECEAGILSGLDFKGKPYKWIYSDGVGELFSPPFRRPRLYEVKNMILCRIK